MHIGSSERYFDSAFGSAQHDKSRAAGFIGHSEAMERRGRVDWRMRQKRYWLA